MITRAGHPQSITGGHQRIPGQPAAGLAAFGRHGDTMVAHINPEEAQLLQSMGGAGTTNPMTGLPEFYGLGGDPGIQKLGSANVATSFLAGAAKEPTSIRPPGLAATPVTEQEAPAPPAGLASTLPTGAAPSTPRPGLASTPVPTKPGLATTPQISTGPGGKDQPAPPDRATMARELLRKVAGW